MIRDDFGYPNVQGDKHSYENRSHYSYSAHETMAQNPHRPDDHYHRLESSPPDQIFGYALPHQDDDRAYLQENADGPMDRITGDGAARGMNSTPLIQPSKPHKRARHESHSDPSFSPPLPGDTGDAFELLSSYSSSNDIHGDGERAPKRLKLELNDGDRYAVAAYHGPSIVPHPRSRYSYEQDYNDRRSWDDHHISMSHGTNVAHCYHHPHSFPIGEEEFPPLVYTGVNHYPHSTSHLYHKRSASTDDETADDETAEEDINTTPQIARTMPAFGANAATASAMRTTGGESTSEIKLHPSTRELNFLPNPRAKVALKVWYQRLRELVAFKNEYGHANVRQKYPANPQLGIWVNKQRCTRNALTREKLAALEAVGFDWGTKKGEYAWNSKYDELVKYRAIHGDCKYHILCVWQTWLRLFTPRFLHP
jgi:Helicase associated domain